MNFGTHSEAEWHAATDRYADALQRCANGDSGARAALADAYQRLRELGNQVPAPPSEFPQAHAEAVARVLPTPPSRSRTPIVLALGGFAALVSMIAMRVCRRRTLT